MPTIEINFSQKAATAISRSAKGIVALVVKDDTSGKVGVIEYTRTADIEASVFTDENKKFIEQCFLGRPAKVIVIKVATSATFADMAVLLDTVKFNWGCVCSATEQQDFATYVKERNSSIKGKKVKAVVYKATIADDIHVVNLTNANVKFKNEEEVTGDKFLPRLTGVLAGLPFTESATYYIFEDLERVVEPADLDSAIDNGEFVLFNDEGDVRVARAVNSLKTVGANFTEDMKKITIVEAMDTIEEDIYSEFKNNYIRKYKNKYDNQCLFLSAVNSYFRALTKEDILDNSYDNRAEVDIESQREAWLSIGKTEAEAWDEITIKKNTFRSNIYLGGYVKILDAIEDLLFNISMM